MGIGDALKKEVGDKYVAATTAGVSTTVSGSGLNLTVY